MNFIEKIAHLKTLKKLIENKTKGNPEKIALKFGVSVRTLSRLVKQLEILEKRKIKFDRNKNYYHFQ